MAYRDHIRRCNTFDLSAFRTWQIGERQVGWLRQDMVERLHAFPDTFLVTDDAIRFQAEEETAAARSAALAAIGKAMAAEGVLPPARGELFPVLSAWGQPLLAELDRRWVTFFGIQAFGVHLNGFVRTQDGLQMWLARRARAKNTYPGALDNMVAGGQPAGLTLRQNMEKEAAEEASVPATLAAAMQAVGQLSYVMATEDGLKLDTLFNFDLELPADFMPRNTDGEVEEFMLLPLAEVAAIVQNSFDFKFNCNLVVIDFLIRHGFLAPDTEPDYGLLSTGLQACFPGLEPGGSSVRA